MRDGGGFSSQEINLELLQINLIRTTLQNALDKVQTGAKLAAIPAASFGGSATATELQGHAGKAHGHVVDALDQTITGLNTYEKSLQHFVDDSLDTDADQATTLTQRTQRTEQVDVNALLDMGAACTQPDNFSNTNACEPISQEGD